MSAARRARIGVLSLALVAVLGLIGWSVFGLAVHQACSYQALDNRESFWLVTVSVAGFVGGHVLGGWLEADAVPRGVDEGLAASRRAKLVVQGLLVVFLGLLVVLLVYEAIALADAGANWPITYYVRCFANTNGWAAGVGAFAMCLLLGQWAWYPQR